MTRLRKNISVLVVSIIMLFIVSGYYCKNIRAEVNPSSNQIPTKIDVFLYDSNDKYISLVRQNFENIQGNNQGKIEFTLYDGMNDQSIQNKDINSVLQANKTDLILLDIVDIKKSREVINRIKEKGIPVILFNREPLNMEDVKSYNKAFFVGTDASQAGILQGQILINMWKSNKNMDNNGNNIMEYVMLMGERDNIEAVERTKYVILTINSDGIKTQELALRVAGWNRNTARSMIEALYLKYGKNIEAIISNNDEMAIGAIEALQKYGYNKGDSAKIIPVVGVDGIPEALELINQGIMTGSVLQDAQAMAEATYKMGMNLVAGNAPLDNMTYEFDSTGVAIRIPYRQIIS
ncbi:galactose ABC transporter substrate-binding protein [Clostridium beijerinckii]|uniref:galactose ABC transporter substrate-binding protein n=1 Tax=Clostridium beijerinckii TaxID=1520 RepID=UPI00232C3BC9|nr:galactose ABC transporter substrate-binding protein [Clostridium beijerinckii]